MTRIIETLVTIFSKEKDKKVHSKVDIFEGFEYEAGHILEFMKITGYNIQETNIALTKLGKMGVTDLARFNEEYRRGITQLKIN